jgi:hypothetical protein
MNLLAWVVTVALFLMKITRYSDPSWLQVFLPVILYYATVVIIVLVDSALESSRERAWRKRNQAHADARRHAAASNVQPLDSIRFPRQH